MQPASPASGQTTSAHKENRPKDFKSVKHVAYQVSKGGFNPKIISRSIKAEAGETTQPSSAPAAFLLGKGRCPWRREVSGGQTLAHITQGALETDYLLSGGQPGRGPRLGWGGYASQPNLGWTWETSAVDTLLSHPTL